MTRRINKAGLAILKHYEDCRMESYQCPAGVWTCGWGSTGKDVTRGLVWTQKQCDERLTADLRRFEAGVEEAVKVKVTDNQFSACVCLSYNIGLDAFLHSTLLRKLNAGDMSGASEEFQRWDKSGARILRGLTRRRLAERDLFLRA